MLELQFMNFGGKDTIQPITPKNRAHCGLANWTGGAVGYNIQSRRKSEHFLRGRKIEWQRIS